MGTMAILSGTGFRRRVTTNSPIGNIGGESVADFTPVPDIVT